MNEEKSNFEGCHLFCRELVNSTFIYIMVWDEDCHIAKKRLKLLQETASNARREPMKERGLDMVCLAEDSGASKWPKAIDLLILV